MENNLLEKQDDITKEILEIEKSEDFLEWLFALGSLSSERINREMLITGLCEEFAHYLKYFYGGKIISILLPNRGGHFFLEKDGKFYDAFAPRGVKDVRQLKYCLDYVEKYFDKDHISIDDIPKYVEKYSEDKKFIKGIQKFENFVNFQESKK